MNLPFYIKNCIELLEGAGFSAFAVGGAVRDSLLGLDPSDWDVTTSARPDQILTVFSDFRTIPTGIKHGTVTVLYEVEGKNLPIEITTYRIDGEYTDSRHPTSVEFSTDVLDDLSRRDFTVNAMAFNEKIGFVDAFGGRDDLEMRIMRAVGDPEKRFSEDALRILRAFRFSAQLGFEIEENTLVGAYACAHLLKNIARERIGVEMKKLLASKNVVYALEKMISGGVWREIFGEFEPKSDVVVRLSDVGRGDFAVRLALLLDGINEDGCACVLDSLRLSNAEKKLISRLCAVRDFDALGSDVSKNARMFLHFYGDILPKAKEIFAFYNPFCIEFFDAIDEENAKKRPLFVSDLAIKGCDLLEICEDDYSRVGKILKLLLDAVIEDPTLNEKEKLLEIAKKSC